MKNLLVIIGLVLSTNVFAAKVRKIEKVKSVDLYKIKKTAKLIERVSDGMDLTFETWGAKVLSKKKSESSTDVVKSTIYKIYSSYGDYSVPEEIEVNKMRSFSKTIKELKALKDSFFDYLSGGYEPNDENYKLLSKGFKNFARALKNIPSHLRIYSTSHWNGFGDANGFAIVDFKTREILFFEMIYTE